MPVLTMPKPSGWSDRRRPLGWALVCLFALCTWYASDGIRAVLHGDHLSAFVILGMTSGILTPIVGITLVLLGRVTARVTYDSTGTTLLPDRRVISLCLSGFALLIPPGIMFMIFVPRGEIAIPMSRGMQIFSPALAGSTVTIASYGLISVWRRGGVGYLKVLPTGIELVNALATQFFDWKDIAGVTDTAETSKVPNPIVLCLQDGTEEVIQVGGYVPHGAALYWMVQHYFRHPDDRAELTDGRAVSRLRDGLFEVDLPDR